MSLSSSSNLFSCFYSVIIFIPFISNSSLIVLSRVLLNSSSDRKHSCFVPDLQEMGLKFLH